MYELTINDLRRLGRQGNVVAKLIGGKVGEVRADGFYIQQNNAIINGQKATVQLKQDYLKIIKHIQNVSIGSKIIAERRQDKLVATQNYTLPKAP